MAPFVFVCIISGGGGRKFLPDAPKPGEHRFSEPVLPRSALVAIRRGTKSWLIECSCAELVDHWNAGGVRYQAVGERRDLYGCESCVEFSWQKVRSNSGAERESVA